ncbi:MAG: sulfur carrier protein ThiS [Planctomycetes bacterium]|nr:sulfur carrier protein ThiS [Planctomycetota bacterium]
MVSLTVNGERQVFDAEPTIAQVLERLEASLASAPGAQPSIRALQGAVAVEVNRVLVPRRTHSVERLRDGDEVEVLTFVGGG